MCKHLARASDVLDVLFGLGTLYNPDNLPQLLLPFGGVSLLTWRGILVAADRKRPSFKECEEEE